MAGFCPEKQEFMLCHVQPCTDEQHFINMEQANEFDNSAVYLSHLMECGDKTLFTSLRDLMQTMQIWQQRHYKLPPTCD